MVKYLPMGWVLVVYISILLLLMLALIILILRILPLIIYVHQPLPFVPITSYMAKALARLPQVQTAKTIVDLGCGTGTLLAALHQQLPQAKLTGVEFKPSLAKLAKLRAAMWKPKPTILKMDMFGYDVSHYDAIVGFWIPAFGQALLEKFVQECKPGCVIVSYMFPLPTHPSLQCTKIVVTPTFNFLRRQGELYVYVKQSPVE